MPRSSWPVWAASRWPRCLATGFSSLLSLQAQPWRMAWLMAVAGAMAFGICSVNLWREGPSARIVLALLVLCWSFETQLEVAAPAAILALLLHFRAAHFAPWFTPRRVATVWIFTLGVSAIWQLRLYAYLWHFAMAAPAGYGNPELILMRGLSRPSALRADRFFCHCPAAHQPVSHGAGVAVLLAVAFAFWDHRTPAQRGRKKAAPRQKSRRFSIGTPAKCCGSMGWPRRGLCSAGRNGPPPCRAARLSFRTCLPPNGGAGCNS